MSAELENPGTQEEGGGSENAGSRPKRYKLYDRIAANVSLTTINIIIAVVAILLVVFIIYGIATGTPPQ